MIYSTIKDLFPTENQAIEILLYQDENDFTWKIARVENGFFVAYFGDPYFKDKHFSLEFEGERVNTGMLLNNTGCFFIKSTDFDIFFHFRNIINEGFTDDIWDSISELLTERLRNDDTLMDCEVIK